MHRVCVQLKLSLLGVVALLLAFEPTARGDDRIVTDASGRAVAIADTSRIVSIGGSITEILYALGLQQKIVAVDTTSLFPPAALQEKPNVGYMRQLSAEGVLALAPTLVLALQGSGPKETIDVLETSKIPFVAVPDKFSGAGIVEKIRVVAQSAAAPGLRAARGARACGASLSGHRRVRGRTRRRRCAVRPMTAATQPAGVDRRNVPLARRTFPVVVMLALVAVLLAAAAIAASIGPAKISLGRIAAALFAGGGDPLTVDRDQIILMTDCRASRWHRSSARYWPVPVP